MMKMKKKKLLMMMMMMNTMMMMKMMIMQPLTLLITTTAAAAAAMGVEGRRIMGHEGAEKPAPDSQPQRLGNTRRFWMIIQPIAEYSGLRWWR